MVSEATDKETGAKWAIKKVNKEKVRLLREIPRTPEWGGGAVQLPPLTQAVSSLGDQGGLTAGETWGLSRHVLSGKCKSISVTGIIRYISFVSEFEVSSGAQSM